MKNDLKVRLVKHFSFLEKELDDYKKFKSLSWIEYSEDRDKRRNVERWIENIVNSSIDIVKIILTIEEKILPDTYREIIRLLSLVPGFDKENIDKVSNWVRFRNIIVHEYLDIKWKSIKQFIHETENLYKEFLNSVKNYLNKKLAEEAS